MNNKNSGISSNNEKYWKRNFSDSQLIQLFNALGKSGFLQEDDAMPPSDCIEAGYTYLGQFLAHEITFNISTEGGVRTASTTDNIRTATIDLDSVYGRGPTVDPLFYDQDQFRGRLYFGLHKPKEKQGWLHIFLSYFFGPAYYPNDTGAIDFYRHPPYRKGPVKKQSQYVPMIADLRNDENIIVAHLHLAIMQFHNRMVNKILDGLIAVDVYGSIRERVQEVLNTFQSTNTLKSIGTNLLTMTSKIYQDNKDKITTIRSVLEHILKNSERIDPWSRKGHYGPPSLYETIEDNQLYISDYQTIETELQEESIKLLINWDIARMLSQENQKQGFTITSTSKDIYEAIQENLEIVNVVFPDLSILDHIDAFILHDKAEIVDGEVFKFPTQPSIDILLDRIFALAKRETILHFQWVVLTDFLPKIVGEKILKEELQPSFTKFLKRPKSPWESGNLKYWKFWKHKILESQNPEQVNVKDTPPLPQIFTGAFMRFGHFMVLNTYDFELVGNANAPVEGHVLTMKRRFKPIKTNIKLSNFFSKTGEMASPFFGLVNKIMGKEITEVQENYNNNIVVRNLKQTARMNLPSAQDFITKLRNGIKDLKDQSLPMIMFDHPDFQSELNDEHSPIAKMEAKFPKNLQWSLGDFSFKDFVDNAPPWFYMGLEAYLCTGGKHLGPVAGRIVAEVILGILEDDCYSIIGKNRPNWEPMSSTSDSHRFDMIEFLKFANMYTFDDQYSNPTEST